MDVTQEETKELSRRLQEVRSYWTDQKNRNENALRFATGDQWTKEGKQSRDGKPCLTLNMTKTYINHVVNPVRKNPFGICVKHKDKKINELYQGLIRGIEYSSNASEAYETALENSVSCGEGYICVSTDYSNDESMDQVISIERITDPNSVWTDPTHEAIDGSDMNYAMRVKYIDKTIAESEHDLEKIESSTSYDDLFTNWVIPENTVPEMLYYSLKREKIKRYWLADGSYVDEKPPFEEMIVGEREVEKKTVEISKYIDSKFITKTVLNIDFIPVVPVYGNRLFEDSWRGFGGIVHDVQDIQSMINYYSSAEAQLVQSAPVSPWVIAEGQISGYEEEWNTANTDVHDHLPYKPTSLNGTPVPPPMRADNRAETSHLMSSRQMAIQELSRVTGQFDSSLGQEDHAGQSGRAILLKQNNNSIATYQYIDNLTKSITQLGRIVVQIIDQIYDTERELSVRGEDGSTIEVNANIQTLGVKPSEFDTEVEAGPMQANEKEMTNATLLEIGRLAPEKFGLIADILVENTMTAGSEEAVERLKKMLPEGILPAEEGAPDPKAMQALQMADQQIQTLEATVQQAEAIIRNLQTQLIDNESDRKAKIEVEQIKAETDLMTTRMDNENDIKIELIKAGEKAEAQDKKIFVDAQNRLDDKVEGMLNDVSTAISDVSDLSIEAGMERTQKVGGPVSGEL
jgi:hypothetical protein